MEDNEDDDCNAVTAARIKNKVAQQKYRDRQREKKAALMQQIALLEKKLVRVETVHEKLDATNKFLEGLAADIKDDQALQHRRSLLKVDRARNNDVIYDWAVCFAEYINSTREYREPQCLPSQVVGHTMTPAACRNLRMNCAQVCWQILHQKTMTAETVKEASDFIEDTRKKKMRVMEVYCHRDAASLRTDNWHEGVSEYDQQVTDLVRCMDLDKSQIKMLLNAKQEWDEVLTSIRQERQAVLERIRGMLSPPDLKFSNLHEGIGCSAANLQQLEGTLSAEGRCHKKLYSDCHEIVRPIQEAIGIASGYKSGVWLDITDLPSIVEQMLLEDKCSSEERKSSSLQSELDSMHTIMRGQQWHGLVSRPLFSHRHSAAFTKDQLSLGAPSNSMQCQCQSRLKTAA